MIIRTDMKCKVSNIKIKPFMSFGKMPMANGFLKKKNFKKEFFYELEVGFCPKNFLFQINDHPKSPKIFNNEYPFFTGKSDHMTKHFANFFNWLGRNDYLKKSSNCIEIGSNDGTFLHNFKKKNINATGFEPSKNVADFSKKKKLKVITKFFSYKEVSNIKNIKSKIDLICAANVICHVPDLNDLIKAIDYALTKDGTFVFEEPYLGSMFKKVSYDQIYDAHIFMFSAHSVRSIFKTHGFDLIDLVPQKTHGGSMRYVIARTGAKKIKSKVEKIIKDEKKQNLNKLKSCLEFKKKCLESKKKFKRKILEFKKRNLTLCGYAASAKSTTLLNYCKINSAHVDYIVDTTKEKIGKYSPGTHIPIVSSEYFRKNYPDILILFAWNHKVEIFEKEKFFSRQGGKWISHISK